MELDEETLELLGASHYDRTVEVMAARGSYLAEKEQIRGRSRQADRRLKMRHNSEFRASQYAYVNSWKRQNSERVKEYNLRGHQQRKATPETWAARVDYQKDWRAKNREKIAQYRANARAKRLTKEQS